jgi:hypothetical protein
VITDLLRGTAWNREAVSSGQDSRRLLVSDVVPAASEKYSIVKELSSYTRTTSTMISPFTETTNSYRISLLKTEKL